MTKSRLEAVKALLAQDWNDLWPRLLLFAEKRIARMYWRGAFGGLPPGAVGPRDIVMKAICKTLSEERQWNQEIELRSFLYGVITSTLNHMAEAPENRLTTLSDELGEYRHTLTMTTSDTAMHKLIDNNDVIKGFLHDLKDDPLVYHIASYILYYSEDKPEQLAKLLKKEIVEINNAKKRLMRRVDKFVEQHTVDMESELAGGQNDVS